MNIVAKSSKDGGMSKSSGDVLDDDASEKEREDKIPSLRR